MAQAQVELAKLAKKIEELPKEDQIWLMKQIIWRLWPQFTGKPVGFYDPSKIWDDWDDEEVDKEYDEMYNEKCSTTIKTQLQVIPALYGEDARAVIEQIKKKPTEEQKEAIKNRRALYAKVKKRRLIDTYVVRLKPAAESSRPSKQLSGPKEER